MLEYYLMVFFINYLVLRNQLLILYGCEQRIMNVLESEYGLILLFSLEESNPIPFIVLLRSQVSNALVSASIKFLSYSFVLKIILLLRTSLFHFFFLLFYHNELNGTSFQQLGMEGRFYKSRDSSY